MKLPLEVRFWRHVDKNGPIPAHRPELGPCWVWTASLRLGYGQMGNDRKGLSRAATHISWFLEHGEYPANGIFACHHCDNRPCVRPSHLFLGTQLENISDMHRKGRAADGSRHARGEHTGSARLHDGDIPNIVERIAAGETVDVVARELNVGRLAIQRVLSGQSWRHLTFGDLDPVAVRSCVVCGKPVAASGGAVKRFALTCSRVCFGLRTSVRSRSERDRGIALASFTKAEAAEIYERIARGERPVDVSRRLGIAPSAPLAIARGNYTAKDGRFLAQPLIAAEVPGEMRRISRFIEVDGRRTPVVDVALLHGISGEGLRRRLNQGLSLGRAIEACRAKTVSAREHALAVAGAGREFDSGDVAKIAGCNSPTANQALRLLARDGLLRRVRRGRYVAIEADVLRALAAGERVTERLVSFDGEVSP